MTEKLRDMDNFYGKWLLFIIIYLIIIIIVIIIIIKTILLERARIARAVF